MDDHIWSQIQTPWKHLSTCYLIAGNFHDNLISRVLKGDISWHFFLRLSFIDFLLSCHKIFVIFVK